MSTSSRRNIKRKDTAENLNNKKKSRVRLPEEPDQPDPNQIIREASNVTDITEGNNINLVFFLKNIF